MVRLPPHPGGGNRPAGAVEQNLRRRPRQFPSAPKAGLAESRLEDSASLGLAVVETADGVAAAAAGVGDGRLAAAAVARDLREVARPRPRWAVARRCLRVAQQLGQPTRGMVGWPHPSWTSRPSCGSNFLGTKHRQPANQDVPGPTADRRNDSCPARDGGVEARFPGRPARGGQRQIQGTTPRRAVQNLTPSAVTGNSRTAWRRWGYRSPQRPDRLYSQQRERSIQTMPTSEYREPPGYCRVPCSGQLPFARGRLGLSVSTLGERPGLAAFRHEEAVPAMGFAVPAVLSGDLRPSAASAVRGRGSADR